MHCLNKVRIAWVFFELLTQPCNVNIHGSGCGHCVIAPDGVEQTIARMDPAAVLDQVLQEFEFHGRNVHRPAVCTTESTDSTEQKIGMLCVELCAVIISQSSASLSLSVLCALCGEKIFGLSSVTRLRVGTPKGITLLPVAEIVGCDRSNLTVCVVVPEELFYLANSRLDT